MLRKIIYALRNMKSNEAICEDFSISALKKEQSSEPMHQYYKNIEKGYGALA